MSWTDDIKKVLSIAGSGLVGLDAIGELAKPFLAEAGGTAEDVANKAVTALRIIAGIVETIRQSSSGKVSSEEVEDALAHLREQRLNNDLEAQIELDARFPK